MAAIAQGIYSENILSEDRFENSYIPKADKNEIDAKVEGWHKAINSTIGYGI
jgi:glycerol kinase